jgi:hypothetical protein
MNRRHFMCGLGTEALAAAAPLTEIHVRIDPSQASAVIPDDFIGLGYEISSVALEGLLDPENLNYIELVRTLSSEGVIRIGGNTSDLASFVPGSFEALGGFLRATGWKLIWGLSLGSGTAESAADQAAAVAQAPGDRLRCFQIGNEPDLYVQNGLRPQGYGYAEYLQDFRHFAEVLRSRIPNAPLGGPDTADSPDWVASFSRDQGQSIQLLTEHYYRTDASNPAATIQNLLNTDARFVALTQ